MASKIGVVADDLTGANDTAVQFAKQGLTTIVVIDVTGSECTASKKDVIVIDTETRTCNSKIASRRVRGAVRTLRRFALSDASKLLAYVEKVLAQHPSKLKERKQRLECRFQVQTTFLLYLTALQRKPGRKIGLSLHYP